MSTNRTKHYQLCQWEAEDKVLRTDFNADNAKIDAALAAKAEASAVSALAQTVAGKADASTLDSVASQVSGHTAALSKKGNCEIWTTTYTGSGGFGSSSRTTITFPSVPAFALIVGEDGDLMALSPLFTSTINHTTGTGDEASLSWNGRTVSISARSALCQMNRPNVRYLVAALIAKG